MPRTNEGRRAGDAAARQGTTSEQCQASNAIAPATQAPLQATLADIVVAQRTRRDRLRVAMPDSNAPGRDEDSGGGRSHRAGGLR
jgi:hypothetical protein